MEYENIIISHYKAIRQEILERIKQRDRVLFFFTSGSIGVLGLYVNDPDKWWGLIFVLPIFGVLTGLFYYHADITLGYIGQWIRTTYSDMIENYAKSKNLGFSIEQWEGSELELEYANSFAFRSRHITVALLIAFIGIGSIFLLWFKHLKDIKSFFGEDLTLYLFWGFLVFIPLGLYFPLKALSIRKGQNKEAISINPNSQKIQEG